MNNNTQSLDYYDQLLEISKEAVNHIDSNIAENVLREIKKNFPALSSETASSDLEKKLYDLKIKMQIVNFMAITDEESANIFKNHLFVFFRIDVPMEERVVCRYNYVGYAEKDSARLALKKAILENKERLGNLTIGEWVNKFEEKDVALERSNNSIMTFFLENQDAQRLPELEQSVLKTVFHVYKKLIALKLVDIFDVAESLKEEPESTTSEVDKQEYLRQTFLKDNPAEISSIVEVSISDALKNYPELGEQLITSNRIKLKSFPEPVRPSINNWLSDYTFNLGFESHSAMDRGTYLFRNENAKVLNSNDREKISYILKAYDENSLVDVNVNTKQIVFSKRETRINEQRTMNNDQKTMINEQRAIVNDQQSMINKNSILSQPKSSFQEIYNAKKQTEQPKDIFREERIATENRNAGNINFSSPQRMPYEKQTIQPIQPQKPTPAPQPMRISSQNLRKTDVPPGNIVNLKE